MRKFRTYSEVDHHTGSELLEQVLDQRARLRERLAGVRWVVAVASGKGGVGKSAVTANLAVELAHRSHRVGVVDADLNGPSMARMLAVRGRTLEDRPEGVVPPRNEAGIRVMSMELLQEKSDGPLRWREPDTDTYLWQSSMETTALREFLSDVVWGELDFLLVDVPPGTDKIRRLLELLPSLDAALVVSTPSEMSRAVALRSLRLLQDAQVPTLALVGNMTELRCLTCGEGRSLFKADGVRRLSAEAEVPVWAWIPFDPELSEETDGGRPGGGENSGARNAFRSLADELLRDLHRPGRIREEERAGREDP